MLDLYNQAVLNVTDACICIAGICWTKGGMISGKSMCTPGTKILPPIPGKLITLSSMKVSAVILCDVTHKIPLIPLHTDPITHRSVPLKEWFT